MVNAAVATRRVRFTDMPVLRFLAGECAGRALMGFAAHSTGSRLVPSLRGAGGAPQRCPVCFARVGIPNLLTCWDMTIPGQGRAWRTSTGAARGSNWVVR
ncbi:hypothetical protein Slala02_35390 [Streptomyces lavendulae subsp. lavendulae]|nr:hypothetical protein Slala01_48440 [Streptomyces lavendulae subsp. lavendulae]GLX27719.1 hypothetical protein Slala02_35390 [Streptomyces lavendulae subsp. lavendulae]